MSAPQLAELQSFFAGSTRPLGKCLGTVNNDMTGHFGSAPNLPWSAKAAANSLAAAGKLYTSACPSYPHFDFYNFVEGGINYGHIDYHVPAIDRHFANSSRCTVYLNPNRTVGTYITWGGARLGWADPPALGNFMPQVIVPVAPTPPSQPAPSGVQWGTNPPSSAVQQRIQIALWKRGRYAGARDGAFGQLSWKGIQTTVKNVGYTGLIDGIPGERTCHFIQVYAAKFGGYTGPINSILGPNSWEGFARGLEAGLR